MIIGLGLLDSGTHLNSYVHPMQTELSYQKDSSTTNQIRRPLGHCIHSCYWVGMRNQWENTCIDDTQIRCAVDSQFRINNATKATSKHRSSTAGVMGSQSRRAKCPLDVLQFAGAGLGWKNGSNSPAAANS